MPKPATIFRQLLYFLIFSALMAPVASAGEGAKKPTRRIAMVLFQGETLAEKGFRETLAASEDFDIRFTVYDAGVSISQLKEILRRIDTANTDLIYTSGTIATRFALRQIKDRPIIFNVVQQPVESHIIESWERSGNNATGVSNAVTSESVVRTIRQMVRARKLAFLDYGGSGGPNYQQAEVEKAQKEFSFDKIDIAVREGEAVPTLLKRIVDAKPDVVIFPSEALVERNSAAILAGVTKLGIASIAMSPERVAKSEALLSLGPDHHELGQLAAQNALEVLRGKRPQDVPCRTVQNLQISINLDTADRLGIDLPLQIVAMSDTRPRGEAVNLSSLSPSLSSKEVLIILRWFICLVIIVGIGVVIGRWDEWMHQQALIKLIDNIFLPCLVFSAIHSHTFHLNELLQLAGGVSVLLALLSLVSLCVLRGHTSWKSGKLIAAVSMSSGTVLLPLAFVLFGNEGLAKAVVFHLFVLFSYHAYGSFSGDTSVTFGDFFRIPSFFVALFGVAVGNAAPPEPGSLQQFAWLSERGIELTAMGALPLLLISFGYPLGQLRWSMVRKGLAAGWVRIVLSPALALMLVFLYRKTGWFAMDSYGLLPYLKTRTTEAVLVLGAAMPTSHYALRLGVPGRYPDGDVESGAVLLTAVGGIFTVGAVLTLIAALVMS